ELSAFRVDDPNLADPDCLVDACRSVDALLPPSELHQRSVSPRCTGRSIRPRAGPCPAKLVNSSQIPGIRQSLGPTAGAAGQPVDQRPGSNSLVLRSGPQP